MTPKRTEHQERISQAMKLHWKKRKAGIDAMALLLDEERLEEIITDSIDLDWTPRTAAEARTANLEAALSSLLRDQHGRL
jgi:DNA polymerase III delta subunit